VVVNYLVSKGVNAGRITDFPMQLSYWLSRSPSPPTAAAKAVC